MKQWFINQSVQHPKRSIIIMIIITLLVGSGVRFIVIDDDFLNMLPNHLPTVQAWKAVQDEFGSTNVVFVSFGHPGKTALTEENLAMLWDITQALEDSPQVDEVISISTLNRMDNIDDFMEVDNLQPYRDLEPEELTGIKAYLDKNPAMKVRILSKHEDYLNIVVRGHVEGSESELSKTVTGICDEALQDYTIHYGGQSYITGTLPALIQAEIVVLLRVGVIIMALILLLSFRNFPALAIELITIMLSLVFMMGSLGWMFKFTGADKFLFTMLNSSMPMILLTIANSYGVHIIIKFFRHMRKGLDREKAISATLDSLLLPIFLTSLTTIMAFLALIFAPLEPLTGYGFAISCGIVWAWLLTSIFMPSLLRLKKWNLESKAVQRDSFIERLVSNYAVILQKNPVKILIGSSLVVIISLYGFTKLNIEVNISTFFKPGTEIRNSIDFLDSQMTGMLDFQLRVEGDMRSPEVLQRMDDIQNFLEEDYDEVTTTFSLADVIKMMHRTVMDDSVEYETIPESRGKINNLLTMYSMSGDPDDFSGLVDYDYEVGLLSAFMRTMATSRIVEVVGEIEDFLSKDQPEGMRVGITGMLVVMENLVGLVTRSSLISIIVSIVIIAIIAGVFFRGIVWGLLAILPLASAVIINFGLMGLFGVDLNHITALLTAIIIGVGVDFAIHYISQFKRHANKAVAEESISIETVKDVGSPILLDAASNMAFGALMISALLPLKHMGGLMVVAMVATSFGTLTLMASIMELLRHRLIKN